MLVFNVNATPEEASIMDGTILRETLQAILPVEVITDLARWHGVVERNRKQDVPALVVALVLTVGSDDSGRLADAYRRYLVEAPEKAVVRGSFYNWMDAPLAELMEGLVRLGMDHADSLPKHLPEVLGGVKDWRAVDSETITLRTPLSEEYPGSGSSAAIKVHKEFSLGCGCMVDFRLSPAKEHDARDFRVDGRYTGMGLLVDLGYASLRLIRDCHKHGVLFAIRLKKSWKPRVERIVTDEILDELLDEVDLDTMIESGELLLDGRPVDADVRIGKGNKAVRARLVGVTAPDGYHFYLTNLSRQTYTPSMVSDLYRVRWEIELDNKCDKSVAQLDQVRATTRSSLLILLYASLLNTLLVDVLVHHDRLELARRDENDPPRPPLHPITLGFALRNVSLVLALMHIKPDALPPMWNSMALVLHIVAEDPNWRGRPSILDQLRGQVAPPGRPRRKPLDQCPGSARPYRRKEGTQRQSGLRYVA